MDIKRFLKETEGIDVKTADEIEGGKEYLRLFNSITHYEMGNSFPKPEPLFADGKPLNNNEIGAWFVQYKKQPYLVFNTNTPNSLIESVYNYLNHEWICTAIINGIEPWDSSGWLHKDPVMEETRDNLYRFFMHYMIGHEVMHYLFSLVDEPLDQLEYPPSPETSVKAINRSLMYIHDTYFNPKYREILSTPSSQEEILCDIATIRALYRYYNYSCIGTHPFMVTYNTLLLNMAMRRILYKAYPTKTLIDSEGARERFRKERLEWQIRHAYAAHTNIMCFEAMVFTLSLSKYGAIDKKYCESAFESYECCFEVFYKLLYNLYDSSDITVLGTCIHNSYREWTISHQKALSQMKTMLEGTSLEPTNDSLMGVIQMEMEATGKNADLLRRFDDFMYSDDGSDDDYIFACFARHAPSWKLSDWSWDEGD